MIDTNLKPKRRQCGKILRSYYTLPLAIENMQANAEVATTASYELREGQSHAAPSSPVESLVIKRDTIQQKKDQYDLLRRLRESIHEDLVEVWDLRYNPKYDYNHSQTAILMGIERKTLYKLDARLLGCIADVFDLWEDEEHG